MAYFYSLGHELDCFLHYFVESEGLPVSGKFAIMRLIRIPGKVVNYSVTFSLIIYVNWRFDHPTHNQLLFIIKLVMVQALTGRMKE